MFNVGKLKNITGCGTKDSVKAARSFSGLHVKAFIPREGL